MSDTPGPELFREGTENAARYLHCSRPFASKEACNAALTAFFEGVEALRVRHFIANVSIVIQDSMYYPDGDAGAFIVPGFYGDCLHEESMLAFALGKAASERQERIYKLVAGDALSTRKRQNK